MSTYNIFLILVIMSFIITGISSIVRDVVIMILASTCLILSTMGLFFSYIKERIPELKGDNK